MMSMATTFFAIKAEAVVASPFIKKRDGNARARYSLQPMADAAMGAEKPTTKETQPLRKPNSGW